MLILLPPSETKRDGGADGSLLDLSALRHPTLLPERRLVLAATRRLSRGLAASSAALKLGPNQRFEVLRNRALTTSPVMPALDRYTGVLFDELDAGSLPAGAREFATDHLIIHSALFGLVGASDPIPAYRLSHDSRLPGLSLRRVWRDPVSRVLAAQGGLVLDLRSEAYVGLGPAAGNNESFFVRVVSEADGGLVRPLNHFGKKAKGRLVRRLLLAGIDHGSVESLLSWAAATGLPLRRSTREAPAELEFVVD